MESQPKSEDTVNNPTANSSTSELLAETGLAQQISAEKFEDISLDPQTTNRLNDIKKEEDARKIKEIRENLAITTEKKEENMFDDFELPELPDPKMTPEKLAKIKSEFENLKKRRNKKMSERFSEAGEFSKHKFSDKDSVFIAEFNALEKVLDSLQPEIEKWNKEQRRKEITAPVREFIREVKDTATEANPAEPNYVRFGISSALNKADKGIRVGLSKIKNFVTGFIKRKPKPAAANEKAPEEIKEDRATEPTNVPEAATKEPTEAPEKKIEPTPIPEAPKPAPAPIAEKPATPEQKPAVKKPEKAESERERLIKKINAGLKKGFPGVEIPRNKQPAKPSKPTSKTPSGEKTTTNETAPEPEATKTPPDIETAEPEDKWANYDLDKALSEGSKFKFDELISEKNKEESPEWFASQNRKEIGSRYEAFRKLDKTKFGLRVGYAALLREEVTGGKFELVKEHGELNFIDDYLTDLVFSDPESFNHYAGIVKNYTELPKQIAEKEKWLNEYRAKNNIAETDVIKIKESLEEEVVKTKDTVKKAAQIQKNLKAAWKVTGRFLKRSKGREEREAVRSLKNAGFKIERDAFMTVYPKYKEAVENGNKIIADRQAGIENIKENIKELMAAKEGIIKGREEIFNSSFKPFQQFTEYVQNKIESYFANPDSFAPQGATKRKSKEQLMDLYNSLKEKEAKGETTITYTGQVKEEKVTELQTKIVEAVETEVKKIVVEKSKGSDKFNALKKGLSDFIAAKKFGNLTDEAAKDFKKDTLNSLIQNELKDNPAGANIIRLIAAQIS